MFKKLLIVALLALALVFTGPATAKVVELSPGNILVENAVTGADFGQFLMATSDPLIKHYTIILHTPGGDAWSCVAIMNRMLELKKEQGVTFTTHVYGVALSAGTYIFMLGDTRIIHKGSQLMFHGLLAQMTDYHKDAMQKLYPSQLAMRVRMDSYVKTLLVAITGWTDDVVSYWIDGGKAQFMSATTAYNTGLATVLKGGI